MKLCSTRQTIETRNLQPGCAQTEPIVSLDDPRSPPPETRLTKAPSWPLAILDQALVSGTRFATTIFLGRIAGAVELGQYAIAFTIFLAMGCLQEALVTTPYAIHYHRLRNRSRTVYSGGLLVLHLLLVAITGLTLGGSALVCWSLDLAPWFVGLAPFVAIALPLSLMWEFARRSMLAQLDVAAVTRTDATAALLQVLGLTVLAVTGTLTAASALAVLAVSTSVPAWTWLVRTRHRRVVRWRLIGSYLRRNWRIGKWLACAQLIGTLHATIPTLLLAALVNAAATGLFAAYFNFALLANPLMLAVVNLLLPKSARAFKDNGSRSAARLVSNAALSMAAILACYVTVLAIWGDRIVALVYGPEYRGHHSMLMMLGLSTIAWSMSMAFGTGLVALHNSRSSFIASLLGTATTAAVICATAGTWSVTGAAAGLCLGSYVGGILQMVFFYSCVRDKTTAAEIVCPTAAKFA